MKIRIIGTKDECALAVQYYSELEKDTQNVKSVQISAPYPNRGSNTVFRVYIDIDYREHALEPYRLKGGASCK